MEGTKTVEMKAMEALEEIRKLVLGVRKVENVREAIDEVLFDYDRFVAVRSK